MPPHHPDSAHTDSKPLCVPEGAKCNMAVFKASKEGGLENCFLFHCPTEQDCPLKAQEGVNTYDIYKGSAGGAASTMR